MRLFDGLPESAVLINPDFSLPESTGHSEHEFGPVRRSAGIHGLGKNITDSRARFRRERSSVGQLSADVSGGGFSGFGALPADKIDKVMYVKNISARENSRDARLVGLADHGTFGSGA